MTTEKRKICIVGTGAAVPEQILFSETIDASFGLPIGTVLERYGVRCRHRTVNETAAGLAVSACEAALTEAGLDWGDIDCLVAASATMDQALPYNAAMILAELGTKAKRTAGFDIGASCLSFLVALDTLSYLVEVGRYRHVLIVSADIATFSLDWATLGESAIFGDGAAAAIIRKSRDNETSALLASHIENFPEGIEFCHIKAGGSRYHPRRMSQSIDPFALFHMDGPRVFRTASRELPRFLTGLLIRAGLSLDEIDLVVPHQASRLALDHLARRLKVDAPRIIDIFERYGNQVGASLPSAMHHAIMSGRARRGDTLLLIGSGAGLTIGGIVLVY